MIMRRRALPGQGANICDLGRLDPLPPPAGVGTDHFRVLPQSEINVIGRMAPMTGI
jgi:hypothetical protein